MWPFNRKSIYFSAPGPTPWYASCRASAISVGGSEWAWKSPRADGLEGTTWLLDAAGEARLILDSNCYVQALDAERALIWVSVGRGKAYSASAPAIRFFLMNLNNLTVISKPKEAVARMRQEKAPIFFGAEECDTFECPTTHPEGVFAVAVPEAFQNMGEILAMADFGPDTNKSNGFDQMFRAIFAVNFAKGTVAVIPQDWFNKGDADFGYQWITRVQRDEKTNLIVGEGIRISAFTLDETGKQLRKIWRRDGYYHIGR